MALPTTPDQNKTGPNSTGLLQSFGSNLFPSGTPTPPSGAAPAAPPTQPAGAAPAGAGLPGQTPAAAGSPPQQSQFLQRLAQVNQANRGQVGQAQNPRGEMMRAEALINFAKMHPQVIQQIAPHIDEFISKLTQFGQANPQAMPFVQHMIAQLHSLGTEQGGAAGATAGAQTGAAGATAGAPAPGSAAAGALNPT